MSASATTATDATAVTTDEVRRLRAEAVALGLSGADFISRIPTTVLASLYNGVGPEWFPASLRRVLDRISAPLLPMVLIHDARFGLNDGTVEQFVAANDELRANGHALVDHAYPRWRVITRWWQARKVEAYYRLCRDFGWWAYVAAYLERTDRDGIADQISEQEGNNNTQTDQRGEQA